MKSIILASASIQRKNLLKAAGIRCRIVPSSIREAQKVTTTCQALVKANALRKAEDVAYRIKKGVVLAADTIVFDGKKHLIGKPRSHKDARKILKKLFARPHWVYTGVAVVDAQTGRFAVDYEKTKVFMQKLSESEMDAYHKHTTPLDKAGGFDIEGRGGLFIRRIEGCYSNVIGLPMARLRVMLKRFGVNIL